MVKVFIIIGLSAGAALAQDKIKINDEQSSQMTATAVVASPAAAIPGVPYTAEAVTHTVQILLEGNHIVRITTNKVARDGNGRVYREESFPGVARIVTINDPVGGVYAVIDANSKTVFKHSSFSQKKADEQAFSKGTGFIRVLPNGSKGEKSVKTDLGTQTIDGVLAKGTRITDTFSVGSDMPLVVMSEAWYSPDLKILVMSKSNDPRIGETTYELTNLVRGEPDPALFHIPADYTLKYGGNKTFFFKDADK